MKKASPGGAGGDEEFFPKETEDQGGPWAIAGSHDIRFRASPRASTRERIGNVFD
jgi:hypothetical protein